MEQPILEVSNVSKTYQNGDSVLTVLKDIHFSVPERGTCAIIGPSGSGKTTLLGLCAGLDQASTGSVSIGGQPLGPLSEDERARLRNELVGFVFQNFQLLPALTALENVMVPMELRGRRDGVEEAAADLLARVGLGKRLGHFPTQLSGGEQQRVALARAFINKPRLLFADEPTGNLDAETSDGIIRILFELNAEAGTALVMVTHDPDLAGKAARVIRLRAGQMHAS